MAAIHNMKRPKISIRKVPSQTKTNAASLDKRPFSRAAQREGNTNDLHTLLSDRIRRRSENRTGLPDRLKAGIEALSGLRMDAVCVHFRSPKPARFQAHAYARGTEIHVAPGQEKHLPHEAWHVVQQMQGRVAPTDRINGVDVNDSAALEREADMMGAKAVQCKNISS